jgi:hypothetical protein
MHARVRTCAGTRLRGALDVGTAARRGGSIHASRRIMYICVRLCVTRVYIHDPLICMRAPVCDGDGSPVCARVGGLVLRARPEPETLKPCGPLPVGVDRVRLRRAGFQIGIGFQREHRRVEHRRCHQLGLGMRRFRPGCAHDGGRARPGFDAGRGPLCAAAPPMHARVRTRACTRLRGGLGAGTAGRRGDSIHASESIYIYMYTCVLYVHRYIIHLSVYMGIGRRYVCVHQCAMVMDRLCAHALAGSCCGLGLKPETLKPCEPLPSAWTACGFGAQAFYSASAFNAAIGAWNTAAVTSLWQVCAASAGCGRAWPGFDTAWLLWARVHTRIGFRLCGRHVCTKTAIFRYTYFSGTSEA